MSWIPCAKYCRHQRDGYCSLDQITPLGTSADEECAYFSRVEDDRSSFEGRTGLGEAADPD